MALTEILYAASAGSLESVFALFARANQSQTNRALDSDTFGLMIHVLQKSLRQSEARFHWLAWPRGVPWRQKDYRMGGAGREREQQATAATHDL
ncbi:MAG: hypothetical protein ABSG04_14345, partial [Verrucomicrobiota bacterium]